MLWECMTVSLGEFYTLSERFLYFFHNKGRRHYIMNNFIWKVELEIIINIVIIDLTRMLLLYWAIVYYFMKEELHAHKKITVRPKRGGFRPLLTPEWRRWF